MEQSGNETDMPSTQLCRNGCGFYGTQGFDGMCSKCYKDAVKRRQQNPSPTPLGGHLVAAAASSSAVNSLASVVSPSVVAVETKASPAPAPVDTSTTPSVETASPTVLPSLVPGEKDKEAGDDATASGGGLGSSNDDPADKDKKPKKNRCHNCKKKVGLTGFQCRCGGLYCGLHRYSDKHDCSFDYKEMGQQQIRKANPVVVGEKIMKIWGFMELTLFYNLL